MDIPSWTWLPELEMEDPHDYMSQRQHTCPYSNEFLDSSSAAQSFKGYTNLITRNHSIQAATINGGLDKQESTSSFVPICGSSSNTFTISFGDQTSPTEIINLDQQGEYKLKLTKPKEEMNLDEILGSMELHRRVCSTRRNARQAHEHVLAERKRREKLTQCFISLSSLLPQIKKIDKATVLEDATKYIIDLQTRVKELQESSVNGKNIIHESSASMKRSKIHNGHEDTASSFYETNSLPCGINNTCHPGIKARIAGSNILVRIYCQMMMNSSLALKALIEMERLHFTIVCNSVLPVSETAGLITITAQMNEEFVMTAMDLVKSLQSSLSSFL